MGRVGDGEKWEMGRSGGGGDGESGESIAILDVT